MLRFNIMFGEDVLSTRTGIQPQVVYNHCGVGPIQQDENVKIVFAGDPHEIARSRLLNSGYVVDMDKVRATLATELAAGELDHVLEPNSIVVQVFGETNVSVIRVNTWMDVVANSRLIWMNMRHSISILDEMMASYAIARKYIDEVLATDAAKFATEQAVTDLDLVAERLYKAYLNIEGNADDLIRLYAVYMYVRTRGEVNDLI